MGHDRGKVRKRTLEIVSFVNAAYKPLNTFIALVGLQEWTEKDNISVSPSAGTTLERFTTWRNEVLVKTYDMAHLITANHLQNSEGNKMEGIAYTSTVCSGHTTGVVQDEGGSGEMGHNVGIRHDGNTCSCTGDTCIMSDTLRSATTDQNANVNQVG